MRAPRIGLISDTHGLLRPEAAQALAGSSLIIHAGDIGKPEVLEALAQIAPVHAVRGNVDKGAWARHLPLVKTVESHGRRILVLHDVKTLSIDPAAEGIQVVVSGHSHQPRVQKKGGVLYVNPGSAGPRRFRLPVSVGRLDLTGGRIDAHIVDIQV